MLAGLFRGAVAELVYEVLGTTLPLLPGGAHPAEPSGSEREAQGSGATDLPRVAVVGDVALGRALLAIRKRVEGEGGTRFPGAIAVVAEAGARGTRKLEELLAGSVTQLPVADGALAAVVGVGAMTSAATSQQLEEWVRTVRDGGLLVLVDRVPAAVSTRQALCLGLTEIEQRSAGRAVVTSGLVTHLPGRR